MSDTTGALPRSSSPAPGSITDITNRMERLPFTKWQVKARVLIGTATFFDAFDALAIAQVLPVLTPLWGLNGAQTGLLISVGYLGQLVGALLFSWVAERRGRVFAMVGAIALFTALSIACALSWNFESLLVFRAFQGLGLGGQVPIAAVYISEITKAHGRGRFILLYELIFSVGVVAAGLVGFWVVPHLGWEFMFLVGALPLLIIPILLRWLPESPRWLSGVGRDHAADHAMTRIEQQVQKAYEAPLPPVEDHHPPTPRKESSWAELFRPPYLRRTLVVWAIWIGAYMVYYGISTWLPTLYRTVFKLPLEVSLQYGLISNVIGLGGATLCALTIDYFGRRWWFAVALAGSGIFLFLLALSGLDTPSDLMIFGSGAYFFATAAAIGIYLYTPELYPTRVRALGVGTATAWLRVASMIGPILIGAFIGYGLASVFAVFGGIAILVAVIVAVFALETKAKVLEDLSP
ncbi:MFS transporter [Pseudonocardia kujensis]|uniref:MFS transporter n=1 Tax=Pseudonocardia kujensis TaxID=1128675 RepID=UPI001E4F0A09|nr:MFS transporter [Pseudonocardia kujensis]MCE0768482.1 MFS transporter [Pseudonocardia kujensis]